MRDHRIQAECCDDATHYGRNEYGNYQPIVLFMIARSLRLGRRSHKLQFDFAWCPEAPASYWRQSGMPPCATSEVSKRGCDWTLLWGGDAILVGRLISFYGSPHIPGF
jgi:hypothetical protein